MDFKYFSMFSGIGGFEYGLEKASKKFKCIGYSEIDKYAISIYEKHYKGLKNYGDARKIDPKNLPRFDLLTAGFPCQAFSVAGKRKGFEDTRGTLFFEIARIAKYKRPRYLLLENVKGLLSHEQGKTFQTIIGVLSDLGYRVEWQVLNSKHFGVPQNRERVFIIGHLGKGSGSKVFPIKQGSKSNLIYSAGVVSAREKWIKKGKNYSREFSQGQRIYSDKGIAQTLAGNAGGQGAKTGLYAIPVLTPDRLKKRQNGRRFKTDGEPAFTLTGQDIHGVYDGMSIRRLTPTECERLQGFPDGWTKGLSDTQRYKCLGNAVTTTVIEAIANSLKKTITSQPRLG